MGLISLLTTPSYTPGTIRGGLTGQEVVLQNTLAQLIVAYTTHEANGDT